MRRTWMALAVAATWLSLAAHALADGVWMDGISARSLARGGTNQGFADNGGILFDNPGAMTNVQGGGLFEGDFIGLQTNFRFQDPTRNAVSQGMTPIPQISFIRKSATGTGRWGSACSRRPAFRPITIWPDRWPSRASGRMTRSAC